MEETEVVDRFCNLLSGSERREFFSLLVEYSHQVERLALLSTRAQEYRLALRLSKNNLMEHLKWATHNWIVSALAGTLGGAVSVAMISLL